jgi:hypothetical protein
MGDVDVASPFYANPGVDSKGVFGEKFSHDAAFLRRPFVATRSLQP